MRALSHLLLLLCSSSAAIVVVWLIPSYVPGLSPVLAIIFGGFVFGLGCLLHLALAQSVMARRHQRHMSGLEEDMGQLLGNQQRLAHAIDRLDVTVGNLEGQQPQNVDHVVAEVKVLQSLVERLYSARAKEPETQNTATKDPAGSTATPKTVMSNGDARPPATAAPTPPQAPAKPAEARPVSFQQPAARDPKAVAAGLTSSGVTPSAASGRPNAAAYASPGPVLPSGSINRSMTNGAAKPAAAPAGLSPNPPAARTNGKAPVADVAIDTSGNNSSPMPPIAEGLDERTILDLVRDGLRENGVELALQPIVSLPQRKRRYYECSSPIRAGVDHVLLPDQYIDIAERHGLITAVDNLMLFRCIQMVRRLRRTNTNAGFFLNISHHTLADRDFFQQFITMMSQHVELAPNLIFEFAQRGLENADPAAWSDLGRLAQMGFRFSVDQIYSLDIDVADLSSRHVRFLKFGADTLLSAVSAGQIGDDPGALKRILDSYAIDLVVDRIESETVLRELLDLHIDFGQGLLFGEPRLVRHEMSAPTAP